MSHPLAARARHLSLATLTLFAALTLLALLAARADAAYTVPNFSLTPSTTQAAGHPNLVVAIDPDAARADLTGDDLKNITIDAPSGMVFNQAAASSRCTSSQLTTDTCPAASAAGTITLTWRTLLGGSISGPGTIYVMTTPAGNAAALGVVLRPNNYRKLSFPLSITNAVPFAAPTRFSATSIPRTIQTSGGLTIAVTIDQINATLNAGATASGPYFTLSPSACATATTAATFVSYANVSVAKSSAFTPTGCGAVPFSPSASLQAAIATPSSATPTSTILSVPQGDAAIQQSDLKSFTVDMPRGTKLNTAAVNAVSALCSDAKLTADTCPAGSIVGNAATRSPLWDDPFTGNLFLMTRSATSLGFGFVLRNSATGSKLAMKATESMVDVTGDSVADLVRQTVTGIPQIPWSAWYLNVNSPLVVNPGPSCATVTASGQLSAWSGSSATVISPWYSNNPTDCAPDTTVDSGPTGSIANSSPSFTFSGTSAGLTYQCQWDNGAWSACTSPILPPSPLADGVHQFCVRAVNGSFIDATPACRSFIVDTNPPTVTITQFSVANGVANAAFASTDPGATFTCRIDTTDYGACVSPFTATGVSGGSHTFRVCAADAAGNQGCAYMVIDVFPVTVTITGGPTGAVGTQPVVFTFTSNAPSGETYQCSLDNPDVFAACTSPVSYTGLSIGNHVFCVRGSDQFGNLSNTACRTFTYDNTPPAAPTVVRSAPGASPTSQTNAVITATANSPGGSLEGSLDGGAFAAITSPVLLSGLTEGGHIYTVRQLSDAGVASPTASVSWTVDTVAPAVPALVRTSPVSSPTTQTTATFTITGAEAGLTFEASRDGGAFATVTSPATLTGLGDGTHTYQVRAVDAAGNVGAPASNTWTVATEPPPPPNPTCGVNGRTLTCTWATVPAGYVVTCALDNGAGAACTSPAVYTALADGAHTWRFCLIDQAGNVSCATYSFTISTPAATVTITGAPPAQSSSVTATFTFVSTASPSTFECQLDGLAFAPCASPATYTQVPNGAHVFCVRGRDSTGTLSANTPCYTWTSGGPMTPPVLIRTSPAASPSTSTTASFTVSGAPAGSVLQASIDGGTFANIANPLTLTGLADGAHLLAVRYIDVEGNTSISVANSWVVDTTAPPAPTVAGPSPVTASANATLTFTDTEVGVTFRCSLDGAAYTPCVSPMTYANLPTGTHAFSVRAVDAAGNISAPGTLTWVFAATDEPPVINVSSPQANFKTTNPTVPLVYTVSPSNSTCDTPSGTAMPVSIGVNTISVTCTSPGGTSAIVSVTGQRAAPLTINPGCTINGTTTAQLYCFPSASGGFPPYTFTCRYDNGAQVNCNSFVSPVLVIGAHTITYCVTDSTGATACTTVTFTYTSGGSGGGPSFPSCPVGQVCATSTDP